jgi:chromate transporter
MSGKMCVAASSHSCRSGSRILGGPERRDLSAAAATPTLVTLFISMVAIGAVLYGSGYVLITFLRSEFVEALGWITEQQLLDAVAIGQVTPGPLFTTATFVGFLVLGVPGAVVATVGIFLPAFAYVALSAPLLPRLRRSQKVRATLDGINAAALGLIGAVAVELAGSAIQDPLSLAIALGSFLVLWRTGLNTAWLIAAGGAIGLGRLALGT